MDEDAALRYFHDLPSDSDLSSISSDSEDETDATLVDELQKATSRLEYVEDASAKSANNDPKCTEDVIPEESHSKIQDTTVDHDHSYTMQSTTPSLKDRKIPLHRRTRNKNKASETVQDLPSTSQVHRRKEPIHKEKHEMWYAGKENDFAQNPPEFLGPKKPEIFVNGVTEYDYFNYMFPDTLFELITMETNRYAAQCGKLNFKLTVQELKTFLGINIMMTYIKYPSTRMYWSSVQGLRMDIIANSMSVNRFEEIKRFIHFVNNEGKENLKEDKFWKVRPVAKVLHDMFHSAMTPEEYQSIDEMMVPFKGKSSLKQYIKSKPKKWGFKVWVKASSKGFVNCFELYEGRMRCARSEFGPVGDSVLRLCHDIHGNNHKLFMDNLFTTLQLLRHLRSLGIFVVGTLRTNRVPKDIMKKLPDSKLLSRGMSAVVTSSDNISIVRWIDNNPVHTISTYAGALPEDEVSRWDRSKKERVEVARPYSVEQYNMFMGGVDLMDRMIAHYPHDFKNKRWYLRVFFHLVNMALVNAWYVFKLKNQDPKMPLLTFKASVATSLIALGTAKKRGRPSVNDQVAGKKRIATPRMGLVIRYDGEGHYPSKTFVKQAPRCHDKKCKRRTRFLCKKCEEPVCPDCMENFHTK